MSHNLLTIDEELNLPGDYPNIIPISIPDAARRPDLVAPRCQLGADGRRTSRAGRCDSSAAGTRDQPGSVWWRRLPAGPDHRVASHHAAGRFNRPLQRLGLIHLAASFHDALGRNSDRTPRADRFYTALLRRDTAHHRCPGSNHRTGTHWPDDYAAVDLGNRLVVGT